MFYITVDQPVNGLDLDYLNYLDFLQTHLHEKDLYQKRCGALCSIELPYGNYKLRKEVVHGSVFSRIYLVGLKDPPNHPVSKAREFCMNVKKIESDSFVNK